MYPTLYPSVVGHPYGPSMKSQDGSIRYHRGGYEIRFQHEGKRHTARLGSAPRSGGDSRVILGVGQSPLLSSAVTVGASSRSG
jgi:hypothetical protein